VATAFLAALWVTQKLARRASLNPELISNLAVSCALAGLAGAKLMMLLFDFDHYARNPRDIFSLSTLQAAGVYQGGFLLAVATAWWYMRRHHLPGLATADLFAPGIALGHAIGRLGCFAAGCCWGIKCDRPWAVTFDNLDAYQLVGVPLNEPLHPTQLYESGSELLIFGLLWWMAARPYRTGALIGWYLVLYSAARFTVDFYRHHEQPHPFGWALSNTQWISALIFLAGAWILMRLGSAEPRQLSAAAR